MSVMYHDQKIAGTPEIATVVQSGNGKPVTSGAVASALAGKQDTLTFDTIPTAGSTNPVTSDGIKAALDAVPQNISFATIADTNLSGLEAKLVAAFNQLPSDCVAAIVMYANWGGSITNGGIAPTFLTKRTNNAWMVAALGSYGVRTGVYDPGTQTWTWQWS